MNTNLNYLNNHLFVGQKFITIEEFLPIYSQVKKEKEVGAFEDFMEGLKVYDKAENGTMMEAELAHILLSLGEKLNDAEAEDIIKQCAGGADDEGFIKYESTLDSFRARLDLMFWFDSPHSIRQKRHDWPIPRGSQIDEHY